MYSLYYWPGLPGRGEFVRLVLEQAGVDYRDVGMEEGVEAIMAMRGSTDGFAPPYLKDGDFVVAQVPAICLYLGQKHDLVPSAPSSLAKALQLFLTVMDVVDEVHDTHHPISVALAYEDQKEAALQKSAAFLGGRLQSWFEYFDSTLASNDFLEANTLSIADLALFQLIEGVRYAFPKTTAKVIPDNLDVFAQRVSGLPRIAIYLQSDRRQSFNETGIFRYYPELEGALV